MSRKRVMRMRYFGYQSAWITTVRSCGRLLGQQGRKKGSRPRPCWGCVGGRVVVGGREQRRNTEVRLTWQLEEWMVGHFLHGFWSVQRTFETHRDRDLAVELVHRFVPTIKIEFPSGGSCWFGCRFIRPYNQ